MKKTVVLLLIAGFCGTLIAPITLAQEQTSAYRRGFMEGKQAAKEDVNQLVEGFWGFLLGGIPVVFALVSNPKLSASRAILLEGKSDDYKQGFRKGYVETIKNSTVISRTIGWSTWLLVFLLGSR